MDEIWYRFQDKRYSVVIDADREEYGSVLEVELYKYYVVKTTPKGVRIALYKGQSNPRFVLRDATKRLPAQQSSRLGTRSLLANVNRRQSTALGLLRLTEPLILVCVNSTKN